MLGFKRKKNLNNQAREVAENFLDAARIVDIRKEGSSVIFTVMRNEETIEIKTYATMGIDVEYLKERLGLQ